MSVKNNSKIDSQKFWLRILLPDFRNWMFDKNTFLILTGTSSLISSFLSWKLSYEPNYMANIIWLISCDSYAMSHMIWPIWYEQIFSLTWFSIWYWYLVVNFLARGKPISLHIKWAVWWLNPILQTIIFFWKNAAENITATYELVDSLPPSGKIQFKLRIFENRALIGLPYHSTTLIGKSWKTHQEIFLEFSFSGSSHRPFYWKTHPGQILNIIYGFSQKKSNGWVFQ